MKLTKTYLKQLVKESMNEQHTAETVFDAGMKKIGLYIKEIQYKLKYFKPKKTNINYGHVGSLSHVVELLDEINKFLGTSNSYQENKTLQQNKTLQKSNSRAAEI